MHVNGKAKPVTKEEEELILKHVYYDESSSTCLRFKNMYHAKKNGKEAFVEITKDGYFRGQLKGGRRFMAHRVVWFLVYGYWPEFVDHNDGDKLNNKADNLSDVSGSENQQNREYSEITGGYFEKRVGKWHSRIKVNGRVFFLGFFDTKEECRAAYAKAKVKLHTHCVDRSFSKDEIERLLQ